MDLDKISEAFEKKILSSLLVAARAINVLQSPWSPLALSLTCTRVGLPRCNVTVPHPHCILCPNA